MRGEVRSVRYEVAGLEASPTPLLIPPPPPPSPLPPLLLLLLPQLPPPGPGLWLFCGYGGVAVWCGGWRGRWKGWWRWSGGWLVVPPRHHQPQTYLGHLKSYVIIKEFT